MIKYTEKPNHQLPSGSSSTPKFWICLTNSKPLIQQRGNHINKPYGHSSPVYKPELPRYIQNIKNVVNQLYVYIYISYLIYIYISSYLWWLKPHKPIRLELMGPSTTIIHTGRLIPRPLHEHFISTLVVCNQWYSYSIIINYNDYDMVYPLYLFYHCIMSYYINYHPFVSPEKMPKK